MSRRSTMSVLRENTSQVRRRYAVRGDGRSSVKPAPRDLSTSDFSAEHIAQILEVFNFFDSNQDGRLTRSEVGDAMRALGENPTEQEVNETIEQLLDNANATRRAMELSKTGFTATVGDSYFGIGSGTSRVGSGGSRAGGSVFSVGSGGGPSGASRVGSLLGVRGGPAIGAGGRSGSALMHGKFDDVTIDFSQFLVIMANTLSRETNESMPELRESIGSVLSESFSISKPIMVSSSEDTTESKMDDSSCVTSTDSEILDIKRLVRLVTTCGEPMIEKEVMELVEMAQKQISSKPLTIENFLDFLLEPS